MTERSGRPRRRLTLPRRLLAAACVLVPLTGLAPAPAVSAGGPVAAQVRVDQVGYAAGSPKRAYLMTSVARPGVAVRVVDSSGGTAFASVIGADQGSWSSTYTHVYAVDFNALHRTGMYHIVVNDGSLRAQSPAFRIDTA